MRKVQLSHLHPSRGMNVEHARMAYHTACETEYQLLYRILVDSQIPVLLIDLVYTKHAQRIAQLSKMSINHSIGRTHS